MNNVLVSTQQKKNTVERSVYFYRTKTNSSRTIYDLFDSYYNKLSNYKNSSTQTFENLKFSGLILPNPKDKSRFVFLDIISMNEDKINAILYSLRDSAFPYLFNIFTGEKKEIPHTMQDTIMDQTHFLVYPKVNIIATEYNHVGCRLDRLSDIFSTIFDTINILEIAPILDLKSTEELITNGVFKGFDLKVSYPSLGKIQKALNLGIIPEFDDQFTNVDNMCISISVTDNDGLNLTEKNKFINNLFNLVNTIKLQFSDEDGFIKKLSPLKNAKVHTRPINSTRSLTIDLFEEKLISKVYPVKLNQSSKYLDSEDMFNCLDKAFESKKGLILNQFDTVEIGSI